MAADLHAGILELGPPRLNESAAPPNWTLQLTVALLAALGLAPAAERQYVGQTRTGMTTVHLSIAPVFCGPMSVGTFALVELLREHLQLGLREAKGYVDRCVFDGERVAIPAQTRVAADEFAAAASALTGPARIHVVVAEP